MGLQMEWGCSSLFSLHTMCTQYTLATETRLGLAACDGIRQAAGAQSSWLVCQLQVIGTLLQEAERMKEHRPLTSDSRAAVPRGHQLWAAALRELMPGLADAPSFQGSHSLANSSVRVFGPGEGFPDCDSADAECQHQSKLPNPTHGQDLQLLGLHHHFADSA